jgi:hypothetical protein
MTSKVIAILGVVSAVAFAIAPQMGVGVSMKTAAWLTLIGTAATAATGALTKYGGKHITVTIGGVAVAVLSVAAGAVDLLPEQVTLMASVIGTAIAAAGKSLFPGMDTDNEEGE